MGDRTSHCCSDTAVFGNLEVALIDFRVQTSPSQTKIGTAAHGLEQRDWKISSAENLKWIGAGSIREAAQVPHYRRTIIKESNFVGQ